MSDMPNFNVTLFYSYCHNDAQYRSKVEKSLSLLKQDLLLTDWSDQNILAGQKISKEIKEKINEADIIVFLFSIDFIGSCACKEEWAYAKQLKNQGKSVFRIPIILKDCPWKDVLGDDDIMALPKDGKPINEFEHQDNAWQQVYEGIKAVINQLRKTFAPKPDFLSEIEKTDFLAQQHIKLQDIFVFLTLSCSFPRDENGYVEEKLENHNQLLDKKYTLIHGEEMSGKTALGRYLFLSLANQQSTPVLHIDLKEVHKSPREDIFKRAYRRQFSGDYSLWKEQENKILILDNLSEKIDLDLIVLAKKFFNKIIITLSSDIFYAFFRDEERLADFQEFRICPLSHIQQEKLIRKRLRLSDRKEPVTDGVVDQIENHVNSIIISKKILPRYPFYVLSILQTYEGFMPENLSITSYGHCYYALILSRLIKSQISREDRVINACFNFAEHLAFKNYQQDSVLDYNEFIRDYKEKFVITEAILNRLKDKDYGIINENGEFRLSYMYHFFLGKFLSRGDKVHKNVIEAMCKNSHLTESYLTLVFTIHHTNDNQIVDDILLSTMCTLDEIDPAQLNQDETKRFRDTVEHLPQNLLSNESVEREREKVRNNRDINDQLPDSQLGSEEETQITNPANDLYRILKNNSIMGQILRNKFGSMEKTKIEEIIETIADSGLRLVNYLFISEEEITDLVHYSHKKDLQANIDDIKKIIQLISFRWTMINIEKIVSAINFPEIRNEINNVVLRKSTPAYDLIGYFSQLDSALKLTDSEKRTLSVLLKNHDDFFIKKVLSIKTQCYMNTHRSKESIEQSICSLLGIKHTYKMRYKL